MWYFYRMESFLTVLTAFSKHPIPILDATIAVGKYRLLDLGSTNPALASINITDPTVCETYINGMLAETGGTVAYGGYLEQRNLYADKARFSDNPTAQRNIHLGMDFWCRAGTGVRVPLSGTVHSFRNNHTIGDYGPTIVLEHELQGYCFYTLYGHLSLKSLDGLAVGKKVDAGTTLGTLGTSDINVNYAPHLHFQIIRDMETYMGDYPGVCAPRDLDYYRINCPDPNLLLKIAL